MFGFLHCDIFNQEKFLLNGNQLRIKLTPAKSTFAFLGGEAGVQEKDVIEDVTLSMKQVGISPAVKLAQKSTTKSQSHC